MPLPKPRKSESQDDFISRCESDLADEYDDAKQRTAICYSQWKRKDDTTNMADELLLYDEIGGLGMTDKDFAKKLLNLGNTAAFTLRLNSPGGDMEMGIAIYNLVKSHPAKVTVVVDALAASAASLIAMAGDEIMMQHNAMMMIHNPIAMVYGQAADFAKAAALLNKLKDAQAVPTYAERTGLSPDDISKMMDDETWLSAQDAVDLRFASGILGKKKEEDDDDEVDDRLSLVLPDKFKSIYRNVPKCLLEATKPEPKAEQPAKVNLSRYENDIAFMELMSQ